MLVHERKTFLGTIPPIALEEPHPDTDVQSALENFTAFRTRDRSFGPAVVKVDVQKKRGASGDPRSYKQYTLVTSIAIDQAKITTPEQEKAYLERISLALGQHIKNIHLDLAFLPVLKEFCSDNMWEAMMKTAKATYHDFFNGCVVKIAETNDLTEFIVEEDANTATSNMLLPNRLAYAKYTTPPSDDGNSTDDEQEQDGETKES